MLFKKHAKQSVNHVIFDLASILVAFTILGPLAMIPKPSFYLDQDTFFKTIIIEQISETLPEHSVEIGDVEISSFLSLFPIEIIIRNTQITGPNAKYILPESKISFSVNSIFSGGMPHSVKLDEIKILIDNSYQDQAKVFAEFFSDAKKIKNTNLVPKYIEISLDELQLRDGENAENNKTLIDDASIKASFLRQDGLQAVLIVENAGVGKIDATFDFDMETLNWQTTANLLELDFEQFQSYFPATIREVLAEGSLSGEVNAEFHSDQLIAADGHFVTQNLEVQTSPKEYVNIRNFSGWFAYDASQNIVDLSNLVMNLTPELKIKGAIQIENVRGPEVMITASAETRQTPIKAILPYLDRKPLMQLNQLISKYTSEGIVDFASVSMSASKSIKEDKFEWQGLQLDAQISELGITAANNQYEKLDAKTKNVFSARLGKGGYLNKLVLNSTISEGMIRLSESERILNNISGEIDFSFQGDTVQKASITFTHADAGEVQFNALFPSAEETTAQLGKLTLQQFRQKFPKTKDTTLAALMLETDNFEADLLFALWPEQIGVETKKWLSRRGSGGEFKDAKVKAFIELPVSEQRSLFKVEPDKLRIVGITGNWGWHDMDFTWKDQSPKISSVNLQSRIFNNHLSIEVLQGSMPRLKLKNGQIELFPVVSYGEKTLARKLQVDATIVGNIPEFNALLDDPTVKRLPKEIKNLTNPTGIILSKISTESVLQNKKLKLSSISAVASLSDASFGNLPLNETLSAGNIELTLEENGQILINGSGKISGVPSTFNGQQSKDQIVQLVVKTVPSEYLSKRIGDFVKIDISGNSAMRLRLEYDTKSKKGMVDIVADLEEAAIDLPILNWAKIPGEPGTVDALVDFSNNAVKKVRIKKALIGTLQADGLLDMSPNLSLKRAIVKNVKFPGYDIDNLLVAVDEDNSLEVKAEGSLIDTTFLRRTSGLSVNRDITFEFSSARLQLAEDITLQGTLIGDVDKLGSGTAILNGTLMLEQSALIEEATIEASFNKQYESLSGTGLIGGAEATLNYASLANDTSRLVIKSQNAGRTLIGLNVLDTIRGGKLELINRYENKEFDKFDTIIKVTDFSIVEAPKSLRALSVLSLTGLYSLIEGDGTRFDVGIADIKTAGDRRILNNVSASGEAIKFQLAGEYDRETDELQVRGILAPLSLLSDLIGVIPLVSNIITGQDKTGFLATQFEMSGQLSDPVTTINPASVLAPGVIRNILSPGWLTKESATRLEPMTQE